MLRFIASLALIVSISFSLLSTAAWSADSPPSAVEYQFLAATDFSPALSSVPSIAPPEPCHWRKISIWAADGWGRFDPELTPKEQALLANYDINGWQVDFARSLEVACGFHEQYGRLPVDGTELFASMGSIKTASIVGDYNWDDLTLPVEQRLVSFPQIFYTLNPATGKVIDSYAAQEWTPFGIWLSTEGKAVESNHYDLNRQKIPGLTAKEWRVVVYGEKEGRVLIDRLISVTDEYTPAAIARRTPAA